MRYCSTKHAFIGGAGSGPEAPQPAKTTPVQCKVPICYSHEGKSLGLLRVVLDGGGGGSPVGKAVVSSAHKEWWYRVVMHKHV